MLQRPMIGKVYRQITDSVVMPVKVFDFNCLRGFSVRVADLTQNCLSPGGCQCQQEAA